jgi:hypothetical protein
MYKNILASTRGQSLHYEAGLHCSDYFNRMFTTNDVLSVLSINAGNLKLILLITNLLLRFYHF